MFINKRKELCMGEFMKLLVEVWPSVNGTKDGFIYRLAGVDADWDLFGSFSCDLI